MDWTTIKDEAEYIVNTAAFLGSAGALVRAFKEHDKVSVAVIRIFTGGIIATISGDLVAHHVPVDLRPFVIFLTGYIGIEGLDYVIDVLKPVLKAKIGALFAKNERVENKDENLH